MRILTVIFSFNTPERTERCYDELAQSCKFGDLVIVDNSDKAKVPKRPGLCWLGPRNVGHGGMIDYVFEEMEWASYDFVGMLNNDTYGYGKDFLKLLSLYMTPDTGIISPAILPGGSCWPTMIQQPGRAYRKQHFVETIAPWYNVQLMHHLRRLGPFEYYGQIDRGVSIVSAQHGFQNRLVHVLGITHQLGIGRDELGTRQEYHDNWRTTVKAWYDAHDELRGLDEVWPEEIDARDWKR